MCLRQIIYIFLLCALVFLSQKVTQLLAIKTRPGAATGLPGKSWLLYFKPTYYLFSNLSSLTNNLASVSSVTLDLSLFPSSQLILLGFLKCLLVSPPFSCHFCSLIEALINFDLGKGSCQLEGGSGFSLSLLQPICEVILHHLPYQIQALLFF